MNHLIEALQSQRPTTAAADAILRRLCEAFPSPPFDASIKPRGHLGCVVRWTRDGRLFFDALPASAWVLFYVNRSATRLRGLDYESVRTRLPQANERSDGVVNIRRNDRAEASTIADLIAAALRDDPSSR